VLNTIGFDNFPEVSQSVIASCSPESCRWTNGASPVIKQPEAALKEHCSTDFLTALQLMRNSQM
jgi:hypothetical protein